MCFLPLRGLLYVEFSILNHEYCTHYSFQADVHVFGYWSIVANFVEKTQIDHFNSESDNDSIQA
jgi:hypothetical protein